MCSNKNNYLTKFLKLYDNIDKLTTLLTNLETPFLDSDSGLDKSNEDNYIVENVMQEENQNKANEIYHSNISLLNQLELNSYRNSDFKPTELKTENTIQKSSNFINSFIKLKDNIVDNNEVSSGDSDGKIKLIVAKENTPQQQKSPKKKTHQHISYFHNIIASQIKNDKKTENIKRSKNTIISPFYPRLKNQDVSHKTKNTRINIAALDSLENKVDHNFEESLVRLSNKFYSNVLTCNSNTITMCLYLDDRIFDIENISFKSIEDHIIIIGYQEGIEKLIYLLICHFPHKRIFLILDYLYPLKECLYKLLKEFKTLSCLRGSSCNPFHLINAGFNNASKVILLSEDGKRDDLDKILSFRTIDYFFNVNSFIELWNCNSNKFLGYFPIGTKAFDTENEFIHPLFMSGQIFYMDKLEKLICINFKKEFILEVFYRLISLGFTSISNSYIGYCSLAEMQQKFPVIVTMPIPHSFIGREYQELVNVLLRLDNPALPLGLYIERPLKYMNLKSNGQIHLNEENRKMHLDKDKISGIKVKTSMKKKLRNLSLLDKVEKAYLNDMKIIRDSSFNNKVVLDYVNINRNNLPVFITNPRPDFLLLKNTHVMVLYHYKNHSITEQIKFDRKFTIDKTKAKLRNSLRETISAKESNFLRMHNQIKQKFLAKIESARILLDESERIQNKSETRRLESKKFVI